MLTIFSKSIPDRLQHGNINETEICYNSVDPSCDILDGIWEGNKSCIFCKVTKSNNCFNQQLVIPANETSVVTINARTNVGYNRNLILRQMFVFQEEYIAEACETLQTFQVTGENTSEVHFNWTTVDGCIGYTLYWCPRGALVGHCREDKELEWKQVNQSNVSHAFVNLPKPYVEYSFAISAEFDICNMTASTGMVFHNARECIHDIDKDVIPPNNIGVAVDHNHDIVVQWDNPSCTESGFIHHYFVKYCRKDQCKLNEYAGNVTIEPSASYSQSVLIRDLKLDTQYKVLIQSCSVTSCSNFTSSQYFDTRSGIAKYYKIFILVGCIFVFVSIIGGFQMLVMARKKLKHFFHGVPIVLPENVHLVHKPDDDMGQLTVQKDNQTDCVQNGLQKELLIKESSL